MVKSARWIQGAVSGPVSTCYQPLWELSVLSPRQAGSLPADSPFAWNIHKQCLLRGGPGYRKVSVLVLTTFRESHALYFLIVLCFFLLSPFSKCSSFNIRLSQVVTILESQLLSFICHSFWDIYASSVPFCSLGRRRILNVQLPMSSKIPDWYPIAIFSAHCLGFMMLKMQSSVLVQHAKSSGT